MWDILHNVRRCPNITFNKSNRAAWICPRDPLRLYRIHFLNVTIKKGEKYDPIFPRPVLVLTIFNEGAYLTFMSIFL